jgi:hypothetical protein
VSLGGTDLEGLKLNTIEASTKDQTSYAVTLKGTGDTNTYASLQSSFDGFVNYLSNNRGINILSKTLDVSNKSIVIKFEYRQQR